VALLDPETVPAEQFRQLDIPGTLPKVPATQLPQPVTPNEPANNPALHGEHSDAFEKAL
jgi:hypothetical protein